MKKSITRGAIAAMVLGIASIPFAFVYGIPGLVLSIIGMSKGKKARDLYDEHPDLYKPSSESFIKTARICSVIGLILSIIMIIVFALIITLAVTSASMVGFSLEEILKEMN